MIDHNRAGRRERKKEETRQKIMKIAMYFFRKQGFESTTMDQIAEEADVAKATLYNYFPLKEAIISEHWNGSVRELKLQILELIQLMPDTRSRVHKTFTKAANELFKAKEDIYTIYLDYLLRNLKTPSGPGRHISGFEDIFSMVIKMGQQAGDLRKDLPVEILVKTLEVMFLTACINWLSDPKLFPLEKTLSHTVTLFIEGAGVTLRKGRSRSEGGDLQQGSLL